MIGKLNAVCSYFGLGTIQKYVLENGSQNKVYRVKTEKDTYIIKEFSKDAISNYYNLNKRKEQIHIGEILLRNNIKTVLPILHHNRYFYYYKGHYYLVYPFDTSTRLSKEEFTLEHLKALAETQANIHNLRILSKLPCTYRHIKLDFKKVLKKYSKYPKTYKVIFNNMHSLQKLIEGGNINISKIKKNLCISHNDYKPLNILWDGLDPVLIDFDATGLVNPLCATLESAYTFSKNRNGIDFQKYYFYLKNALENQIFQSDDFKSALYVCMNGKLRWLDYLLSKERCEDVEHMINELVTYYNNISKLFELSLSI